MARRKDGPRAWVRESHRNSLPNQPRSKYRWEVVYETGTFKVNGDGKAKPVKRTKGGFTTKSEAEAYRDKETPAARYNAGRNYVPASSGDQLFQAVAEHWLGNYRTKSGKARGKSQHAQIIEGKKSLVRVAFGERRIGDITEDDITAWLAEVEAKRSGSTVRHNFYTLRLVLRSAHRNGLIRVDPTDGIDVPEQDPLHIQQANQAIPTGAQVDLLIDLLPEPWGLYVWLAAETGMRPEELTALQLRDVSDDRTLIHVRRVRVKTTDRKGLTYEDRPKTAKSNRHIDLDDATAEALADYIDAHQARAQAWFATTGHDDPGDLLPLFVGVGRFQRGQRQRKQGTDLDWLDYSEPMVHGWFMDRHWAKAREAAGIDPRVRFYDLRHYHATWLVNHSDYNPDEIATRLGHASTKMTWDRYIHSDRDSMRAKRSSLGSRKPKRRGLRAV